MSTTTPEAAELRRSIYDKGAANRTDLVALIHLGPEMGDDPEFIALVAEVARDVIVGDAVPPGYISEEDADWLTARLGDGHGLSCRAEFETLKSVLAHAVSAPSSLVAFGVREIERAILTGRRGPLGGVEHEPGIVTADDVEALRVVAFAPTAGAAMHVDRAAAEALFDIAHATATAPNDPAFAEFFARAIGNYLIGAVFVAAPRHEEADGFALGLGGFLMSLAGGLLAPNAADGRKSVDQLAEERSHAENAETEARLAAAAKIDAGEAKWILAHLTRGGDLSAAERRLLGFLREESTGAPAQIAALFDHAA
jgi:hypothetical protein